MGLARLRLPPSVRRAILDHAARDPHRECCGLLVGAGRTVLFAVPIANVDSSAARYRIDDRAHIDLQRTLRSCVPRVRIIGVYHSHPHGSAQPSPADLAEAHYPDWVHVIIGLGGPRPRLGAFLISEGRARRLSVSGRR